MNHWGNSLTDSAGAMSVPLHSWMSGFPRRCIRGSALRGGARARDSLPATVELTRFGGHLRVPTGGSEYGQVQVKMG